MNRLGIESVYEHDVAPANRLRVGLGMSPSDSPVATVDHPHAGGRLERAAISALERGGRLRASCHIHNTADHIDAALDALTG